MDIAEPRALTVGVIAELLNVPLHRVLHVLRTRDHITPTARAGVSRVYDNEAVVLIRFELGQINNKRRSAHRRGIDRGGVEPGGPA